MEKKKVLIIGNGGREEALAWKLAQSPKVDEVLVFSDDIKSIDAPWTNYRFLAEVAKKEKVHFTIIGSENALANGFVDAFQKEGLRIFGPTKAAAEIESSKVYAKQIMKRTSIPTAKFEIFHDFSSAFKYLKGCQFPTVIKADGLSSGKGVFICRNFKAGLRALRYMMIEKRFGAAGNKVIIEEYLDGHEVSIHAICDKNETAILFPASQDHKQLLDRDRGPNTGGMGAYAPVPNLVTDEELAHIGEVIVKPLLDYLKNNGKPFSGCLFPGIKMTPEGPKVLEFNARFGDPETQTYMRLLNTDLFEIVDACIDGKLSEVDVRWRPGFAVCVVLASEGYPGEYRKGFPISGIDETKKLPKIKIFQSGVDYILDGTPRTYSGRVLNVTATGRTIKEARHRAYGAVKEIDFQGMHFRKDISLRPGPKRWWQI